MTGELIEDDTCITLGADPAAGEAAIKEMLKRILPEWKHVAADSIQLTRISGGISNLLVKATPTASSEGSALPRPVAVKVFGDKTELLIDREVEQATLLKLSALGFGAKVVAVFGNGRIEEFLNCVTLTPDDMAHPRYVPRIARKLRRLHAVDPGPEQQPGLVFGTIQGWMDMARTLTFDDPDKAKSFAQVDLDSMQREIDLTRHVCEAVQSPMVFAHNDLLSGNILIIQADGIDARDLSQCNLDGPMQFIDFEYSCAGYRGFDWGNHFNEYAGFDCDYTRYPTQQAQDLFFTHYMANDTHTDTATRSNTNGHTQQAAANGTEAHTAASQGHGQGPLQPAQLSSEQLRRLRAEANVFALASHIYWGVWALIQARYSPIEFDFLEYSALRWSEYHKRRDEFISEARQVFGIQS